MTSCHLYSFNSLLDPFHAGKQSDSSVFDLVGVVNHSGSINGGHYTAFNFNSFVRRWYRYNDATVTMVEPQHPVTDSLAAQVALEKAAATAEEKSGGEDEIGSDAGSCTTATSTDKAADAVSGDISATPAPTSGDDVDVDPIPKAGAAAMDVEDDANDVPPDAEAMVVEAPAGDSHEKEKEYNGKALSSYKPEELDAALHDQIVTPEAYLLFYVQREETSPYNGHRFDIPESVRKEFEVVEEKTSETKTRAESDDSTPVPVDTKTPEAATASGPTASAGPMDLPTSMYPHQLDGGHKRSKSDPINTARIHPASMGPPSDEAIAQFISFTNTERDVAISFLNRAGNDATRAIQIFYS